MKYLLRLTSYSVTFKRLFPLYIFLSFLIAFLSLINFGFIKPILDVLFNEYTVSPKILSPFGFNYQTLYSYFYHYVYYCIQQYNQTTALSFICITFLLSICISNALYYIGELMLTNIRIDTIKNLRLAMLSKIFQLEINYFIDQKMGDMLTRSSSDIQIVEVEIIYHLKELIHKLFKVIIYIGFLIFLSSSLTLFAICTLTITGCIITYLTKTLKRKAEQGQSALSEIIGFLEESIWGVFAIKSFTAEDHLKKIFKKKNEQYTSFEMSIARRIELSGPIAEIIGVLTLNIILIYGSRLLLNDEPTKKLTSSELITYLIIFSQVLSPTKKLARIINQIQKGITSLKRIFFLLDQEHFIQTSENKLQWKGLQKEISFQDIGFHYGKEHILNNINFKIKKGELIALIGPSGGGKSTIAKLIPRFYDPTTGNIQLDGKPLKHYNLQDVRKHIGLITQESFIFQDTIFNNIAFGKPKARLEKVIEAAKIANAHQFIMKLPNGYNSMVGEKGCKLSGGQKQRINIARVVFKKSSLFILDEATSSLDVLSEQLIHNALGKIMHNAAVLIITHRLSTIQKANKILVLDKGRIVEEGNHNELLKRKGLYTKLLDITLLF